MDDFDFVVVGEGTKYQSSEVIVDEIVKYGYDKKRVIVSVSDSIGKEHFLTLQSLDKPEIHVSVDFGKNLNDFAWTEIKGNDNYIKRIELIRNYVQIGFVILVFVVGYLLVKGAKKKLFWLIFSCA